MRYVVVGSVRPGSGAPGTNRLVSDASTTCSTSTTRIAMAPFGHDCTHAGASPAASRPLHMSHLRTMPLARLYFGAS